jgi:hypothetical protein
MSMARFRIARKARYHDDWTRRSSPHDPYGPGVVVTDDAIETAATSPMTSVTDDARQT